MTTKENREYKNTVFVDLFFEYESAEANDIALYNALHDEPLPEGTMVERIRIEDTLYMNFKNDISFKIGEKVIVFGEHQSTVNENMPLRSLMYVGRFYELTVDKNHRYTRKRVSLPKPEFYTFYNGLEPWGKEKTLRLSDSYKVQDENPMLEVEVKVININPQEGHEVLERCQVLKEYGLFVDTIRKLQAEGKPKPFKEAIRQCIQMGILSEYLKKRGSEVYNMLIAKYDYETDIKVQRQEAREEGREEVLTEQVKKKLARGESVSKISEALEEDVKKIEEIIRFL
jgi:hypothetical protein